MADRTVRVRMTAETRSLVTELKAATKTAEELSAAGVSVKSELKDLSARADKAGVSLLKLAADGRITGDALKSADLHVSKLNRDLAKLGVTGRIGGMAGQMKLVSAELDRAKAKVKDLSAEFQRTGSASALAALQGAKKEVQALTGQAKALGVSVGTDVEKGVEEGIANPEGMLLGLLIAAGVMTSPLGLSIMAGVGSMLGASILSGVGGVALGAGIKDLLKNDPELKAAGQELAKQVNSGFADAASPLGPQLKQAIADLGTEWQRLQPGLKDMFAELAPEIGALERGFAGFLDKFVPSVERAAVASKPLLDMIGHWLPEAGRELAQVLDAIASHEAEAEFGLKLLFATIKGGVDVIRFATWVGSGLANILIKLTDFFGRTGKEVYMLGRVLGPTTLATHDLVQAQISLKSALDGASQSFEKQIKDMLDADNVAINYQQNVDDLTASVKANGTSLDITTQKGRNNKRAVDELIGSLEQNYEANLKAGMGADAASAQFGQQVGALQRQMAALHFSKAAIDSEIAALDAMRLAAIRANSAINDTGMGHTHHDFAQGGLRVTAFRGLRTAAVGRFIPPSDPGTTLVGEPQTGGEWLIPNRGISAGRAKSLLSGAASAHGMDVVNRDYGTSRWMGGGGGGGAGRGGDDNSVNLHVHAVKANLDGAELQQWQANAEARHRVGRRH